MLLRRKEGGTMLVSAIQSYGNFALNKSVGVKEQQINFKGEDRNFNAPSKELSPAPVDVEYTIKSGGKVKRACVDIERMSRQAESMFPNLLGEADKIKEESHECKQTAVQKLAHVISALGQKTDVREFFDDLDENRDMQKVIEESKDDKLVRRTVFEHGYIAIQEGVESLSDGSMNIKDEYVFINNRLFAKLSNIVENTDGSITVGKEIRYKNNSITECMYNEELSPDGDISAKCVYAYNPEGVFIGYREDVRPYNVDSLKIAKQLLVRDGKELDCYSEDLDIFGDDAKILKQLSFKNGKPDYYISGASLLGEKSYVALQKVECKDGKPSCYYDGAMKAQDGSFTYLRFKKI